MPGGHLFFESGIHAQLQREIAHEDREYREHCEDRQTKAETEGLQLLQTTREELIKVVNLK
jgi:hypothetical protein